MKISIKVLNKKGLNSKGQQFFVFRWLELVHKFTIDSHRFRAMNSKSILQELCEAIDYVEKDKWDSRNIKLICEEAAKLIKTDRVLPSYPFYSVLTDVINAIQNSAQYNLQSFISGILKSLETSYLDKLITGLKTAIASNDLDNIDWYTATIVTELINSGYARAFLQKAVRDTIIEPQEKPFEEKFKNFVQTVRPRKSTYTIYLKLHTDNIDFPPELNLRIINQVDFPTTDLYVKQYINSGRLFFQSDIEALDPYSAAIAGNARFGTVLDLIRFVVQKPIRIDVDKQCLVMYDNQGRLYQTNPTLGGYLADNIMKLPIYENQLLRVLNSPHVSHSSKDKLKGALRYFRLGLEGATIEHQFLNFWIALEHVVKTGKKQAKIIDTVISFIPKTLALNYIRKITLDTVDLITKRSFVTIPAQLVPHINRNSLHKFIELIRDEGLFRQLVEAPNVNPLIEYRLEKLRLMLANSASIRQAIGKNRWDIEHHLARMYRYRNKIVHQAAHDLNIAGITTNLLSYVNEVLIKLLHELNSDYGFSEIQDVFMKYTVVYDKFMDALSKDTDNEMDLKILIDPTQFVWPPSQKLQSKTIRP